MSCPTIKLIAKVKKFNATLDLTHPGQFTVKAKLLKERLCTLRNICNSDYPDYTKAEECAKDIHAFIQKMPDPPKKIKLQKAFSQSTSSSFGSFEADSKGFFERLAAQDHSAFEFRSDNFGPRWNFDQPPPPPEPPQWRPFYNQIPSGPPPPALEPPAPLPQPAPAPQPVAGQPLRLIVESEWKMKTGDHRVDFSDYGSNGYDDS